MRKERSLAERSAELRNWWFSPRNKRKQYRRMTSLWRSRSLQNAFSKRFNTKCLVAIHLSDRLFVSDARSFTNAADLGAATPLITSFSQESADPAVTLSSKLFLSPETKQYCERIVSKLRNLGDEVSEEDLSSKLEFLQSLGLSRVKAFSTLDKHPKVSHFFLFFGDADIESLSLFVNMGTDVLE